MSLADELRLTIIECGELVKSDIQRPGGLSHERYWALQNEVDRVKVLRDGPKATGGYEATYAKRPCQPDESLACRDANASRASHGICCL